MVNEMLTRRELVAASGAGLAALVWAQPARSEARGTEAASAQGGVASFVTEPTLRPPTITVSTRDRPARGYLFLGTLNGPGQRGPMIVDDLGRIVWFRPVSSVAIGFRRQVYRGRPVLTWWEGQIADGVGQGEGVILDQSYRTVARVRAGNGYAADVHELLLTPQGTALITVYAAVQADLSGVGGPASGTVLDSIVQEVDVATGRVVFEWHSLDHVPLTDSYAPLLDPFDYFHVNSVDVDLDGNLIVSARNTSAVYSVDRRTGAVLWRLGGRSSDFDVAEPASFMYQHDARAHTDGTLTLFDNGPTPGRPQSRALRLGLDRDTRRAYLLQEYSHPAGLASAAMGNVQVLDGDRLLVGWGAQPYVTEFDPTGAVRLDARFDGGAWNYRAFRSPWVGRPIAPPSVRANRRGAGLVVRASWNGSTETRYWRLAAGDDRQALRPFATVRSAGFETTATRPARARFVSATPLDAARQALHAPRVVAVR